MVVGWGRGHNGVRGKGNVCLLLYKIFYCLLKTIFEYLVLVINVLICSQNSKGIIKMWLKRAFTSLADLSKARSTHL
jgi:hypothetical protein